MIIDRRENVICTYPFQAQRSSIEFWDGGWIFRNI